MPDNLTSIRGRKLGLDVDGNVVIGDGDSIFVENNASTKPARVASAFVATAPTTAVTLVPYGVHYLTSAQGTYALGDPVPGQEVKIVTYSQTTAASRLVQTSTVNGVTMGSSGAYNKWTSTAAHALHLVGITTSQYAVLANNAVSTVSTSVGSFSTV
jgi:hypothetical protein